MPASVSTNFDSGTPRRSPRLKKIHIIYDEDSDRDSSTFNRIKTEVIDSEEIASPSTSELSVASVSDKDGEQDCHDVSLKVIKAQCKAKNRKTTKTTLEGCDIMNRIETEEEFDLDKPLIALKQKRPKTSPAKANRKMEAVTSSPCAVEVEHTTSKRDDTLSPTQSSPFKATMDDPTLEKLGRRANDLEQSKIAIYCTEEISGEQICCAEVKNTAGALASCEKTDVLCEIKIEHIDCSEGFGTSSCSVRNSECLSFELQQELMEDDECIPQACFTNKPNQLGDGSDHSCEQTCAVKENSFDDITEKTTQIASLSGIIDEVSNRQKTSENISNSDVDKSSTGNGILASLSQSCHDRIDNDEYWNTGVAHGNEPESVKILEELSPIDESSTDMVSLPKMVESDLCGSTEMNCTSLEEVVQMQGEYQLDSVVCLGVRPKHMLLDAEIEHTVSDYTFSLDKTLDLTQPVNFVTQDGRLESIVYDVLNNHAQRMTSENRSSVGLPDTAVIQSTVVNFNSNSSEDKSTSDSKISFAPNSFVTSLESDGQIKKSELFIDEESIEEHGPKKLLSKRKIMSPTSQEKLCNALTGIDLCDGVQRLKRKIVTEDCDKTRISLPQPALKQYQSMFSTDRKLKGRTDTSPTSKGILKSTGFPPHQQTTCSCMRNSSVVLDTEKAVEFSQRQMHDVENIAAKLIRSLKHMRSIVDESLSSEAYSLLPNFNIAEIRAASEDALEVEKTTRKWLSIMNKDCNRFCKILSLAKKNVVSHPEMPRKQRKIIFADETGGTLCHVKVFKDGQTSLLSECQSDL